MENKNLEVFSDAPVPKAVLKNVLPAMAAMVMVLIYNLADTLLCLGEQKCARDFSKENRSYRRTEFCTK